MSKADKRENIIMIASEPLTFEKGKAEVHFEALSGNHSYSSGLDGNTDELYGALHQNVAHLNI